MYRITDSVQHLGEKTMENKECKIVCGDKTVATISCKEGSMNIVPTKEGKELCKDMKGCCE
ncbi:MAG: hypothetical protein ACPK7O_02865 [Methanobacterium sp.]